MNAACIRLKQSRAINSWLGNLSPEQSPIVRDFMIPREMMVREAHNKMISWLNVNIKEIPELNITIHSQNEDRFRKLVTELKNQFTVPANIKNDKAAISEHYDNVAIAIADRFASYKERLNDDVKFHKFILSMTRMSYIRKSESVKLKHDDRNNFDRWLFTSPKNSDHMVLEYFYEAMLWFRNRDK
jgi:predicted type IV restriction endonuclease